MQTALQSRQPCACGGSSARLRASTSLKRDCVRCPKWNAISVRGSPQTYRCSATVGNSGAVNEPRDRLNDRSGVVTDKNVPEGHQGLHGFLYGDGGAEVHETSRGYQFREGEDDGQVLIDVESYLEAREGEVPLGVYALYDTGRNLQYVGYSRNIVLAIRAHLSRVGEDRCTYVRPMVFMNRAMSNKTTLEKEAQNWIDEAGTIPPGNGVEQEIWEGVQLKDLKPEDMSEKELAEYEEKKLRMRKAMGENLRDDVKGESLDSKERRLRMIAAVEGDDWSEVIDGQTKTTIDPERAGVAAASAPEQIVSPFARARVHRSIGNDSEVAAEDMVPETVDRALDEVRPYLISDGGNVEVAGVEDGVVFVRMQGACGTCPSSTATLKMGIERALKAKFGDQLKEVMQVDAIDTSASITTVDSHLDLLRPAIEGYGGKVDVSKVQDGVCEIIFKGPKPIGMGITAAIKDKFPDIKEVVLLDG
ncbi:hypothetical protein BSKO_13474 [Bryopsis sp. KO-2023]|nr:hypothetical protein BSKO_13474 [Bryopsis sp. KO-2023]